MNKMGACCKEHELKALTNEEAHEIANVAVAYAQAWGAFCCNRHNDVHPDSVYDVMMSTIRRIQNAHNYHLLVKPNLELMAALWKHTAIEYRKEIKYLKSQILKFQTKK